MATQSLEDEKIALEIQDLKNKEKWFRRFKRDLNGFATLIISLGTLAVLYFSGNFSVKKELLDLQVERLEDKKKALLSDSSSLVKTIAVLRDSINDSHHDIKEAEGKLTNVKAELRTATADLNETIRKKKFNDSLYTSLWKNARAQANAAFLEIDTVRNRNYQDQYRMMQVHRGMEAFWNSEIAKLRTQLKECEAKFKTNP